MTPDDFSKYSEFFHKEPPKNMTKEEKQQWEKEEKKRKEKWEQKRKELLAPFFTYSSAGLPVLPGSSIRGMLRNLLEIVSFSKIERVSGHERLFFRAVASNPDKESWGKEYKTYVDPKKIQAGYLKKDEQGWYIQPAKTEHGATFAWVRETSLSLTNLKKFNDGKYEPQYISVSYETVAVDNTDRAKRLFAQNVELQDIHQKKGVLVTSGNMKQGNEPSPRRNHCVVFECLVFEENSNSSKLRLNDKTIEHYRNALTDFQKGAPFNKDWGVFPILLKVMDMQQL
jgi:CRISPR/Cas system CMR subunit Cmr4 (Cas7 group RAMP superfamily)